MRQSWNTPSTGYVNITLLILSWFYQEAITTLNPRRFQFCFIYWNFGSSKCRIHILTRLLCWFMHFIREIVHTDFNNPGPMVQHNGWSRDQVIVKFLGDNGLILFVLQTSWTLRLFMTQDPLSWAYICAGAYIQMYMVLLFGLSNTLHVCRQFDCVHTNINVNDNKVELSCSASRRHIL